MMKRKSGLIVKLLQLFVVIMLAVLMVLIFLLADTIQVTGKVINYTGIVRGATQRMIKLEIAGQPNDELIVYLDEILKDLQHGGGKYDLEKLNDEEYLDKLNALSLMWEELKGDVNNYRKDDKGKNILVEYSEVYFVQANEVVGSAEYYSEKEVRLLRIYESLLGLGLLYLIISSLQQTLMEMQLTRKNKELSIAAYIDKMTGIPSRRSCDEMIWCPVDLHSSPYCVIMFDLNNLKEMNDHYGHHAGDKIIKSFADILNHFSSEKIFVGRFGGDEFLVIVHGFQEEMIKILLTEIQDLVNEYNGKNSKYEIRYAYGYEFGGDNLHKMLEKADVNMYVNKKKMKENIH